MDIEDSRRYIETRMLWRINEKSFKVIDEEACVWVAEVTTTHLPENGSFFILVQGYSHFIIEKRWRHKLGAWFGTWL